MGKRRTLRMEVATKMVAKAMTINCVRNTILERYHMEGKLSDTDMKAFNKVVVNRIYTFFDCLLNRSEREKALFLGKMVDISERFTGNWDELEFDKDIWPGEKAHLEEMRWIQRMKDAAMDMKKGRVIHRAMHPTTPLILRTLGSAICRRRKRLGISQERLAKALGCSVTLMERYERGESDMGLDRSALAAQALKCRLSTLLKEHPVAFLFLRKAKL